MTCTCDSTETLDFKKIKAAFQEQEIRLNELRGLLIGCARKIKIFIVIAEYKQKHTMLYSESFWGWLQIEAICPEVMMSCYKLAEGISEYVSDFLKLILPEELAHMLKKKSLLKQGIKSLSNATKEFELFRNKRAAHIECVAIAPITFDIKKLFNILGRIDSSLNYINHFLLNPHLIAEERWDSYKINEHQDLDSLEKYFNYDYAIQDCIRIFEALPPK